MATHSSVLAWRIPGTGEPSGLPPMGSHRVGHDWSDLAAAAAGKELEGKIVDVWGGKKWSPLWWTDRSPGLTIGPNVIVKHGVVRPREGRQVQGQHLPGAQPLLHAAPAVRFEHRPHAPHQREDIQSSQVLHCDLPALLLCTQETFLLITSFSNQDLALIS